MSTARSGESRFARFRDTSRKEDRDFLNRSSNARADTSEGPPSEREQDPSAGGAASDAEEGSGGGGQEPATWDQVVELYREGSKKKARVLAARCARRERTFVTLRRSEDLYVLDPDKMFSIPTR